MRLQTELAAVVLGFVASNLILVFVAIGLFVRMGPAIERILLRNDATIAAAEEILVVFARSPAATPSALDRERIVAAIDRVESNITESGEGPVIEAIRGNVESALAGDRDSRAALVGDVQDLIAINRDAMRSVDREAQRIGQAGAWAAAFVGLASLGSSLILSRGLGNRVLRPILELRQVLLAAEAGDRFRRCTLRRAPPELREVLIGVNELLDARTPTPVRDDPARPPRDAASDPGSRPRPG